MDTNQITQIVEAIKTLNLNVDSKTLENVTAQLMPLLWTKIVVIQILEDIFWTLIFMTAIILAYKAYIRRKRNDYKD